MIAIKLLVAFIIWIITSMVIESVWFMPKVFGETWRKLHGYTPEQVAEISGRSKKGMPMMMLGAITAFSVTAIMFYLLGNVTPIGGLILSCLLWLGWAGSVRLIDITYAGKPLSLWFVDPGYMLPEAAILGALLGFAL